MINGKREQKRVDKNNMLEVVNDRFTLEEINSRGEEVPIECPTPRKLLFYRWLGRKSNDFLERKNLNENNETNNVYMTGSNDQEEATNHHQSPYCSNDKVLFLLFLLIDSDRRLLQSDLSQAY